MQMSQCSVRPRSGFFTGTSVQKHAKCSTVSRQRLEVQNFKFMKNLGLKKPEFLPDFGLEKRKVLLATMYTTFNGNLLSPVLHDELKVTGAGKQIQTKQDYITLLEQIKGAMPDFEWSHDTTGAKDEAGFATVTFQGEGKFDGTTFAPPKTPPVEPHGKQVTVPEQTARIMVEDGVAKEIEFSEHFLDKVYTAIGGKIPLAK